jgi:hypothetical protein
MPQIMKLEQLAQSPRLDAWITVRVGVKILVTAQAIDRNSIGFYLCAASREGLFDQIMQQPPHRR